MNPIEKELKKQAAKRGLDVVERGQGHYQITGGPLLVNYYPLAKRRSAYVAGTTSRRVGVSPAQAVEMAFTAPSLHGAAYKDTRDFSGRSYSRRKIVKRLRGKYGDKCHWCGIVMTFSGEGPLQATIEHVIPLNRGGLDNFNNMRLAHKKCNNERGDNMPELEAAKG